MTFEEGGAPAPLTPFTTAQAVADLCEFAAKDQTRFGTGWSVDDTCGQLGLGELMLVWARSGSGKSTLALNIIRNTPEIPTLVVNMEMTARRQIEWLTSMTFDLSCPSRDIESVLRWGPDDPRYAEVRMALSKMESKYPALHWTMPTRPSVSDLQYLVEDIETATGVRPQRVFIDHMGLMKDCMDYTTYVKTAGGLHSWAMRDELALVVLQQTGRTGDGGKNDGHLPVTLSSGVYGGEADADWIVGMYRPDRDPKFKKSRYAFDDPAEYERMLFEHQRVQGITVFQVVKNRPFSDLLEGGIELRYDMHTRRLNEPGYYER